MAASASYQNIDLVPKEALDQIATLDKNLKHSLDTTEKYLQKVHSLHVELSKHVITYKELNSLIAEYNKAEQGIIAVQKEQSAIIQKVNKVRKEVLETTTEQVKEEKSLNSTIAESKKAYDSLSEGLQEHLRKLTQAQIAYRDTRKEISNLDKDLAKGNLTTEEYADKITRLNALEIKQKQSLKELNTELKNLQKDVQANSDSINNTVQEAESFIKVNSKVAASLNQIRDHLDGIKQSDYPALLNSFNSGEITRSDLLEKLQSDLGTIFAMQNRYNSALKEGNISVIEHTQAIDLLNAKETEATSILNGFKEEAEKLVETNKTVSFSLQELRDGLNDLTALNLPALLENVASGEANRKQAVDLVNESLARSVSLQAQYKQNLDDGSISASEYQNAIQTLTTKQEELNKASDTLNNSTKGLSSTITGQLQKAYNVISEEAEKLIKDLSDEQAGLIKTQNQLKLLEKQYKQNNITQDEYLQSKNALTAYEEIQSASVKKLSTQIQLHNKILNTTAGSYDNLSAQYSLLKLQINGADASLKINGKTLEENQKHAKALYEEMKQLQEATGKHQLNVGNYDSAVKDLTRTISILDPKIGIITNKVRQLTPLKSAWIKVNDQLVKSLKVTATTATLLQAAVVGLAVGGVLLAIDAFKKLLEEQKKVKELQSDFAESVGKGSASILLSYRSLQEEWKNLRTEIEKTEFIQNYSNKFEELGVKVKSVVDAEKILVDNTDDFLKALQLKAKAQAAYNIAVGQYEEVIRKQIELENTAKTVTRITFDDMAESYQAVNPAIEKIQKEIDKLNKHTESYFNKSIEYTKKYREELGNIGVEELINKNADKKREKALDDEQKAYQKLLELRLKIEKETAENIYKNDLYTYAQRISALNEFTTTQEERIREAAANQLKNSNLTRSQRQLIEEKAAHDIEQIWAKHSDSIKKIEEDREKEREKNEKELKKSLDNQAKTIQSMLRQSVDAINELESTEFQNLSAQYANGEIKKKEYEEKKTELTRKYADERFEAELQVFESLAELYIDDEQKYEQYMAKIADARLKNAKDINDAIIKDNERKGKEIEDDEKRRLELLKQLARQFVSTIGDLFSYRNERQEAELDNQLDQLQKHYDDRLAVIDDYEKQGLISAENADAQRKYYADEQKKREEEIEQQRKEIALRQAKFDKAQALVDVAIQTSVAIVKALPNLVLVGLVSSIGALQAATIAAQPLPKYMHGTLDHPGGDAWIGDGGKAEMIIYPSGKIEKSPAVPTIKPLPEHTQVLPDFGEAMQNIALGIMKAGVQGTNVAVVENRKQLELMRKNNFETKRTNDFMYAQVKMTHSLNRKIDRIGTNNRSYSRHTN